MLCLDLIYFRSHMGYSKKQWLIVRYVYLTDLFLFFHYSHWVLTWNNQEKPLWSSKKIVFSASYSVDIKLFSHGCSDQWSETIWSFSGTVSPMRIFPTKTRKIVVLFWFLNLSLICYHKIILTISPIFLKLNHLLVGDTKLPNDRTEFKKESESKSKYQLNALHTSNNST